MVSLGVLALLLVIFVMPHAKATRDEHETPEDRETARATKPVALDAA